MAANETKRERFVRLAEARTNKILDMLKLLGNCSSKSNYEYTDDDVKKIFNAIENGYYGVVKSMLEGESGYGYLTVIGVSDKLDKEGKHSYRICQCDCGNVVDVFRGHLKDGHTRSCGCMISFGEDYVVQFLSKLNYNVKRQYKIEKLKDKNELPFDIAIFDSKNKLIGLIEVQGKQHFDSSLLFYSEDLIKHDKMKYEYCLNNKIPLLLLDYRNGKEKTNFLEWNNLINKFLEENNGLLGK